MVVAMLVAGAGVAAATSPSTEVGVLGKDVRLWDGPVNMRPEPWIDSGFSGVIEKGWHLAECQREGQYIEFKGNSSTIWVWIYNEKHNVWGYVSTVFVSGPAEIPGLRYC